MASCGGKFLLAGLPLAWVLGTLSPAERADPVREELASACRSMRAGSSRFYGEAAAREAERRADSGSTDQLEQLRLRGVLAVRYLELGRLDEAVGLLRSILEVAGAAGLDDRQRAVVLWNLGLGEMLAAERANCIARRDAATRCIFPFTREALHHDPTPARRSGDAFLELLRLDPTRIEAAWLLNLNRMLSDDFPEGVPERYRLPEGVLSGAKEEGAWRDIAPDLGVAAFDLAGGALMDDFDGDGRLDLISSSWDPCVSMKAYRNDGRGGFEEVTTEWGLDAQLGGLNLVQADYDGDGRLDILVLRGAWLHEAGRMRNSLLRNRREGSGVRFVDVTREAGLAEPAYPTQTAAWADYDRDGDLDLYVGNEVVATGVPLAAQLFRNNGDGSFTDVALAAGVANMAPAKGVAWGDFDDDGDPDLYVSNIGTNRLYRNEGDGTFVDVATSVGVGGGERRTFATWFFDFDNDGDLDIFVADYASPATAVFASYFGASPPDGQPRLYRNDGGSFREVSREVGLVRPLLPMGAGYGDIDGDGWLDVYLGTGEPAYSSVMPNVMYRNLGGTSFREVVAPGGFGHLQKGHGVAFGDLDEDGDLDLFHQLGGFFAGDAYFNALYENPGTAGRWVSLRLRGRGANTMALGARVEVRVEDERGERSIHRTVATGGSFGGSSTELEIGLGAARRLLGVRVRWPAGGIGEYGPAELDRAYEIVEGGDGLRPIELPAIRLGDASDR